MSGAVIALGVMLVVVGLAFAFIPGMGRLPGDVRIDGDGWTVYAPIGTSIVLSVVLTLALALFRRTR